MTPTLWEVETEGSLGFSGFQPSSGFSERPCLNSGNYVESEEKLFSFGFKHIYKHMQTQLGDKDTLQPFVLLLPLVTASPEKPAGIHWTSPSETVCYAG